MVLLGRKVILPKRSAVWPAYRLRAVVAVAEKNIVIRMEILYTVHRHQNGCLCTYFLGE